MKLSPFKYAEPKTLRAASRMLEEEGGAGLAIAGGTDLLQALKNRLKKPSLLVSLTGITRLREIRYSDKAGLQIGALVTLAELARHPVVRAKYPVLAQAALAVGSTQLQAMGTVGGNLCQDNLCLYYNRPPMARQMLAPCLKLGGEVCHAVSGSKDCWAVYSGDLAPVLMTLGACVQITDRESNFVQLLEKLYSRNGKDPNTLKPGQLLSFITLPAPAPNSAAAYLKLRVRQTIDYPLLGVAVALQRYGPVYERIAVGLTGIDKAPLQIHAAEQWQGSRLDEQAVGQIVQAAHKEAHPLANVSELPAKYRREMVDVYVRMAIQQAIQKMNGVTA